MSVQSVDKDTICRFCLGIIPLGALHGLQPQMSETLVELNSILNLEIYEEDVWPKQVCSSCESESKLCLALLQMIKVGEKKLTEIFGDKFGAKEIIYPEEYLIEEVKAEVIEEIEEDELEFLEEEDETYSGTSWVLSGEEDKEQSSQDDVKVEADTSTSSSKKRLPSWRKNGTKKMQILKENNAVVKKYLGFKCDLCPHVAKNYYSLRFHYREHHNMLGYMVCCGTKFTSLGRVAGHVKIHIDPEAFKCPKCQKVLSNEITFRIHARECQKEPESFTNVCEVCSEAFPTPRMLKQHQKKHLSEDEKPFECPDCSKRYVTSGEMKHHWTQVHNTKKDFLCDVCGKGFRTPSQANAHKKRTHIETPQPKEKCDRCGGFYGKLNMYSHRQRCKVDPVWCQLCGKECCNEPSLKTHMKYEHEGVERKKFVCNICPRNFSTKRKLTDHKAKHQDIALHKCNWCDKKFFTLSTKTAHQRTQHPVENAAAKIKRE